MKLIQNINNFLESCEQEIYLTVGNFDGVHLGHRDFLSKIKQEADATHSLFVVLTFTPHPLVVIKAQSQFLINTYHEKRQLLEGLGVDYLYELEFNRDFSTMSPEDFLNNFILFSTKVARVYFGHDFQFGAHKSGGFELAFREGAKKNILVSQSQEYLHFGQKVSSSTIRNLLKSGDVQLASKLLGRPFFISGRVIKGVGRGRQIGFPTANLGYDKDILIPSNGVYVTRTSIGKMQYFSVTNVGLNPTFETGYSIHIETHLMDFNRDIYGEEIQVHFLQKIRDEIKFSSVNELVQQINLDLVQAKKIHES